MDFIRSNLVQDLTVATGVLTRDLPTNPISHLIVTLTGLNVTDEATLAEILAFINSIQVTNSGKTIYNLQSEDVYAQNVKLFGHTPMLTGKIATDNEVRSLTLMVPFGRTIFNPDECLFGAKKGDVTLRVDLTIPATSLDGAVINIETVELPDANPSRYLRSVLKVVSAPGATGENEVDLPIGNLLVAAGIRMTTRIISMGSKKPGCCLTTWSVVMPLPELKLCKVSRSISAMANMGPSQRKALSQLEM